MGAPADPVTMDQQAGGRDLQDGSTRMLAAVGGSGNGSSPRSGIYCRASWLQDILEAGSTEVLPGRIVPSVPALFFSGVDPGVWGTCPGAALFQAYFRGCSNATSQMQCSSTPYCTWHPTHDPHNPLVGPCMPRSALGAVKLLVGDARSRLAAAMQATEDECSRFTAWAGCSAVRFELDAELAAAAADFSVNPEPVPLR